MNSKKLGLAFGLATVLGSSSAFANIVINPIWDSTITNDANAAQIEATINQAIGYYSAHFTDNISVTLNFAEGGGLGSSSQSFLGYSYSSVRSALVSHATTGTDSTALAHLPIQTNEPVTGNASVVYMSRANARVLGLFSGTGTDCSITLNTSICNLVHGTNTNSGNYDLYGVACHEIDEALGTVSFAGSSAPSIADLYRYDGNGNRSWDTSTSHRAYFSVDGTTNIVEYNQLSRTTGDWGDWVHHSGGAQVQDWSASPGVTVNMGTSENTLLDAVGYSYVVPEPASFAVLGIGIVALVRRRRRA